MTGYDPQLLTTLLAVEQTGSFTRAAARLGIQQPTVSQHIRRLERQVGRTLVQRDTHSVALTADGEAMVGFARNILGACEQAAAYFSGARPGGRARPPSRSACVCRGVNGLIGAVAAGIGISAMAASLVPAQLATLGPGHRLPELGTIALG